METLKVHKKLYHEIFYGTFLEFKSGKNSVLLSERKRKERSIKEESSRAKGTCLDCLNFLPFNTLKWRRIIFYFDTTRKHQIK